MAAIVRISGRDYFNIPLEGYPVDYKKLQLQLFTLEMSFGYTKDIYGLSYPKLNPSRDTRIIVFSKCINVISSALFAIYSMEKIISGEEWWEKLESFYASVKVSGKSHRHIALREYDTFIRAGFAIHSFSAIESSLRDFLRALLPEASAREIADVKRVYGKLLQHLRIEGDYNQLLDLFRLVRNTMHNNGVYFNPWRPDEGESIEYRGIIYDFKPNEPVDFANWDFVLMLLRDSRWLLFELVLNFGKFHFTSV